MGSLTDWIIHRARMVGLSWPDGVADSCGIAPSTLASIISSADLRSVGRSSRAYIARALKVSLREFEALGDGKLNWIGDDRVVDLERLSPNSACAARPAAMAIACRASHGVPVLGRILETGIVEHDDLWTPEDGARISVRYPEVPDAFALELMVAVPPHGAGSGLVFQAIAAAEFQEGELGLVTRGAADAETGFFMVHHDPPMSLRLLPVAGSAFRPIVVTAADILRAARVIGAHRREGMGEE